MLNKYKKGISLIVLVITIVAIIIISTTLVVNIVNTSIFGNTKGAVFKADISNMQDELSMYISDKTFKTLGEYEQNKLQATEDGIWYEGIQQQGTIKDIISIDDKYAGKLFIQDGKLVANKMLITVDEEKWLNDLDISSTYQADIGKINIIPSTTEWINGNVELNINYTKEIPEGYEIEYKVNASNWQEGTRLVVEENNTVIIARLYSKEKDNEALINSYTVANIDKDAPNITNMQIDIVAWTNAIVATASGATDTLSGIEKYQYSIDGVTWKDIGVFSGYKNATEVTVYAKVIDKVGNESNIISNVGTTTSIAAPTINLVNNEWTKNDVVARVTGTSPEGYVLEYKLSGGMTQDWTVYSGDVTITTNNTTIVARFYNKDVDDEIASPAITVSKIDKVAPDIKSMRIDLTSTPNSITAVATGATDNLSGNVTYKYSLDNVTWHTSGTFSGIKSGTDVTVYAKAIDKVGNESGSISTTVTTDSILGAVTISQNPAEGVWTKDDVTITLGYASIPLGYKIEYRLGTEDWTEYNNPFVISENNTTVTARLYNLSVEDEVATNSKTILNIDKEAPDITNMKISLTTTTNSITAIASGATDDLSGNVTYQYRLDNTTWQDSGTFNGIKSGTDVTVYAKATDKVGNIAQTISNKGTTSSLGAVTITQNPAAGTWTNGNVTVTLSHIAVSGYTLQYKIGSGAWTTYSSAVTIIDNCSTITARMYNPNLDDEGDSAASKVISNIDKVVPTTPTSVSITVGTNSVTAKATGSTDTLSGFSKYQYSLNNSTWQDSGTFSGIKSGTATTVYARAVDKVGNVSGSISNKGTTSSIGVVTITQSPTAWTNGNVTVTLSHAAVSGYTLQYKIDSGAWTTYSSALTVSTNNTKITSRMYNATLDDEGNSAVSKTISNIDKVAPVTTNMKLALSATTNSITATASGATDALSGNVTYKYSKDNSTWQTSGTFSSLTPGTSYTIYAKAVDKVGNESASINSSVTTQKQNVTLGLSATSGTITYPSTGTYTVNSNPSGGILSVTSSNTAVATASISGTTVTITPGTTAGTSTITVTSAATATCNASSATYTVTVKNGTLSVTASGYSGTYNGSAHGISVSCSGATIKYGTSSGSYTLTSSPTYTNAGTYTVFYQVSKAGYTTVTGSKQVVISKANGSVTLSATSGTIEKSKTTTFTVKTNTSGGGLSVSSSNTNVATASISGTTVTVTGKTTAGKATITVTSAATTNYNAASATYIISVTNPLLRNVVAKGDYVNYPVTYTNISAFCGAKSSLTGWRVLYIYDNCVYLVSAGDPIPWRTDYTSATTASALVSWGLNSGNFTKYVNSTYAQASRLLAKDDLDTFNGSSISIGTTYSNTVIKTGGVYCLATVTGSSLYSVNYNGAIMSFMPSTTQSSVGANVPGLRLIIKLKSDIRTTGKNSSGVWQMTTATGL